MHYNFFDPEPSAGDLDMAGGWGRFPEQLSMLGRRASLRTRQLRAVGTVNSAALSLVVLGAMGAAIAVAAEVFGRARQPIEVFGVGWAVVGLIAVPWLGWAAARSRGVRRSVLAELDELAQRRALDEVRRREEVDRKRRISGVLSAGDTLQMVFQPIIDLRSGTCVGHEALARFQGHWPPETWFNEAHAVGLGTELEMAAISRAARSYPGEGYLSVNLSPETLTSPAFVEYLARRRDASRIIVELTEHAVVTDYERIRTALGRIRRAGARVAVDDTGSGISSMQHILAISPEIIKLDRSLIAHLDTDPARRALAASLVQFAATIGAELVAEGIEREEERIACQDLGIAFGQGHLLGRPAPLPADDEAATFL